MTTDAARELGRRIVAGDSRPIRVVAAGGIVTYYLGDEPVGSFPVEAISPPPPQEPGT